jgi:hypothetical protein
MTVRASSMGFLMWVTPHTAPAFRVLPSMIEASNSLRPSRVNTEPRPALNKGLSSSTDGARHRIQAGAAGLQHRVAGRSSAVPGRRDSALQLAAHFSARQGAGAAVNARPNILFDFLWSLRRRKAIIICR